MHAATDASLYGRPKEDPSVARGLVSGNIHSKVFDPGKALVPRIDTPSLLDISASDGYLNKAFYLASYSGFRLKRFDSLLDRGFRPFLVSGQRVVAFVGAPPQDGAAFQSQAAPVDFRIVRYMPDRVDYEVTVAQPTTLVFNEIYFPGWQARVDDGKSLPMQEAAGGLRALTVAAGRHAIATRFSPATFWIALGLTMLSWVGAGVWLAWDIRRARKTTVPPAAAQVPAA
jgi:hypothetical protein